MKQFVFPLAIVGIFISTSLAAPWVVLDSRNDMLAMSSEVYDTAVAYAVPPPSVSVTPKPIVEEPVTTTVPEPVVALFNDDITTTKEQPRADPTTQPESELNQRELRLMEGVQKDDVQTTVKPVTEDDIQQDLPEVTTVATSSSSPVDSLVQQDIIPSEGMMDVEIKFIPDMSNIQSRQNPNSIEEDEPVATVVVVNKKKHELFNKKSKFQMK